MPRVHIALQDGFEGDTLAVQINGQQVYQRSGLKTRMQVGLADKFDINVGVEPLEIQVDVPTRQSSATIPLGAPSGNDSYVGISISSDGAVTYRISEEPFRYA